MSKSPQFFPPTQKKPLRQYPSATQKAKLHDLLEADLDLKRGKYSQTFTKQVATARWQRIGEQLNAIPGATKTYLEWRKTWQDIKSHAKRRQAEMNAANMTGGGGEPSTDQEDEQSGSNDTKLKKRKDIVFTTLKQACVDLVKKHGHSVSLFDEEAFRTILQLLPITAKQKAIITSEYIQKYLTGEEDDTVMGGQDDQEASDNDYEPTEQIMTTKWEIQEVQCTCDARAAEDSTKGHELWCPAAAQQPYWNYFKVTTDEATCQICSLTLNWSNITKLKDHLVEKHPTTVFVDDGVEFTRGPASDVWSHEDTEEIYLGEDLDGDPLPTPTANKRRRTSELFKCTDEMRTPGHPESRERRPHRSREKSRAERMTEMRAEREGLSAASRRVIELAPDRFKSLDSFGQYVAELMKLIPKEKCLKYQVQIVQRLLQEQAAAG